MNPTLIMSHCVSMLYDHCTCTCISYLFLCVLCFANCKDASEEKYSAHSCLICRLGALLKQYEYKLVNVARSDKIVS